MKKWTALLLALVMCLSLCACGGKKIGEITGSQMQTDGIESNSDEQIDSAEMKNNNDGIAPAGTYTLSEFFGTGRHIFYELWDNRSYEFVGKDGYTSTIYVVEDGTITKYTDVYYAIAEESNSAFEFNYFGSLAKMTDDEIIDILEKNSITPEEKIVINAQISDEKKLALEQYENGEITLDQLQEEQLVLQEPGKRPIKWPESKFEIAVFTDNSGNDTDFEQLYFSDSNMGLSLIDGNDHIYSELIGVKMSKIYNGTTPVYDSHYSEIRIYTTDYPDSERYWVFRNNEGITLIYDSPNSNLLVDPKQEAIENLFN